MVKRSDADWFHEAKWGVFCHYLPTPPKDRGGRHLSAEEWNKRVDEFDVGGLADQLESVGANYFFITIGQNTGHYCAPNAAYDQVSGISPSKCSRRDLISDLSDALAAKRIRLLVYLPSGAPAADREAMEKFEWEGGFEEEWGEPHENRQLVVTVSEQGSKYAVPQFKLERKRKGKRLTAFQIKWEDVIREWSLRWGKKVSGWWIDGCYFADEMYRHPEPPNFQSFAAAMKAGNPDAIVAFNPGVLVPVISHTEHEDYTAGEISDIFPVRQGRWIDGAQYHLLSYLGQTWGEGPPRLPDELVIGYTKQVIGQEGVITWDVPISHKGLIEQPFIRQLKALNKGLSGGM